MPPKRSEPRPRQSRRTSSSSLLIAAASTSLLIGSAMAWARQEPAERPDDEDEARRVCGTCHAFPPPDLLPRSAWRDEFVRMMFIREERPVPLGPRDLRRLIALPEDFERVLPFYTRHAPERLPPPEPWPDPAQSPLTFVRRGLSPADLTGAPAISNVKLVDFNEDGRLDLLATDMMHGTILYAPSVSDASELSVLASLMNPAHVTPVDLDGDGLNDLLIADLGEFFPRDHSRGAVIVLRGVADGKFGPIWLDGWPRVAHVEAGDFDGNGKLDLVVAAFGYHTTGHVAILENRTVDGEQPSFVPHVIDERTGSIHVLPTDLNGDGHLDFVALFAQEHETVVAFINRGEGDFTFDQHVIYTAPHPNWGSTGIQLVDLDGDGDLDILLTHGDTFDDGYVKPYHGIQWLENTGSFPWVDHRIALMPGVHRAQAADLTGNGRLDIVACALLAGGSDVDESTLPALVWLEQTKPGVFVRHTIAKGFPRHATLDLADIDGDGDIDIVVGYFAANREVPSWIEIWENQRINNGRTARRATDKPEGSAEP